jgi:DNA repair exonuclease SbcCD nuclease subunit
MKIVHISDTHLGKRPKNTRADTINHEIKPLEDDFYFAWIKIVKDILDMNDKPDVIIHSGDFFDSPSLTNTQPPPERARIIATETFRQLNEINIPLVMIDGNHGRYDNYRDSTLSMFPKVFDNIYFFSHYDIRDAIKASIPLKKDFPNLNLRVLAFPYFNFENLPQMYADLYEKWITIQNNNVDTDMINIAVAHGMIETGTLHTKLFEGNYNYIALGDNHKMDKIRQNSWYSGCPELWSFNEVNQNKGYLLIEIKNNNTKPEVTPITIKSRRRIVNQEIETSPNDTTATIIDRVKNIFNVLGINTPYEYSSAARVRIILKGERTYGDNFNLNEIASYLRSIALDSNDYNIVEFVIQIPEYGELSEYSEFGQLTEGFEYLLENPEKEFNEYVTVFRSNALENQNLDPHYLSKLFAETIKKGEGSFEDTET